MLLTSFPSKLVPMFHGLISIGNQLSFIYVFSFDVSMTSLFLFLYLIYYQ